MLILFGILVIIASVILGLIVLVQNPKGGGLSGTFGGAANQIFGYKRTTDDIERITWGLVVIVFALCLSSAAFKPNESVEVQNGLRPEAVPPTNSINMSSCCLKSLRSLTVITLFGVLAV